MTDAAVAGQQQGSFGEEIEGRENVVLLLAGPCRGVTVATARISGRRPAGRGPCSGRAPGLRRRGWKMQQGPLDLAAPQPARQRGDPLDAGSAKSKGRSTRSKRLAQPKKPSPAALAQTIRARTASTARRVRECRAGLPAWACVPLPRCGFLLLRYRNERPIHPVSHQVSRIGTISSTALTSDLPMPPCCVANSCCNAQ